MTDPFYTSHQWHKLRSKVKAKWKANHMPCGYCGKPLDWQAKPIVDHIKPRSTHPQLALDETNLMVVHHRCNTRKYHFQENAKRPLIGADGYPIC